MPTGSYDSSVVSVFTSATQPLSIFSDNIFTVPFAFQPVTFWSNNYLASYSQTVAVNEVLSSVIVGLLDYPTVVIDANDTTSPSVFIIK